MNSKSLKNKVKEKELRNPMMRKTEDTYRWKRSNCVKAELRKGGQNVLMNRTSRETGIKNSTSEEERRKEGRKVSMRRTY